MKVMIVDNDRWVLTGIRCLLEKEMPDLSVHCFDDAMKALAFANARHPALVISDIEMPIYNGLELCQKLQEEYSPCIIIISSFDKFQYAQQAISLGVKHYVLKPINQKEFTQLIGQVKKTLQNQEDREQRFQDALKAKFFLDLVDGRLDLAEAAHYLQDHWSAKPGESFSLCLLHIEDYSRLITMLGMIPSSDQYNTILDAAMEDCPPNTLYYELERGHVLFLIFGHTATFEAWLRQFMAAATKHNCTITAGFSLSSHHIQNLSGMYHQAVSALQTEFIEGSGKIFYTEEGAGVSSADEFDLTVLNQYAHQIAGAIASADAEEELHQIVEKLFEDVPGRCKHQKKVVLFCQKLMFLVSIGYLSAVESNSFGHVLQYEDRFHRCKSLQQLKEQFLVCLQELRNNVNQTVRNKSDILKAVTDEMLLNDCGNVSLDSVADRLDIHPTYLSVLFKEKLGVNFKTYISEYKIKQAKYLLSNPEVKIHTISKQLGYMDAAHFSKIFKKHTGINPSDYRQLKSGQRSESQERF